MTREQRIVQTFVELADTLADDFDVIDFLHRLAQRCVALLDCAEAGLLLIDASGVLRVMASSSERSDALELLQWQSSEGPCLECYQRGGAGVQRGSGGGPGTVAGVRAGGRREGVLCRTGAADAGARGDRRGNEPVPLRAQTGRSAGPAARAGDG